LGRDMREAGVEVFRYASARDVSGGINVALFSPRAFASKKPKQRQSWLGVVNTDAVEFSRKDGEIGGPFRMPRAEFEVDGRLPAPAF
ncbi:MAG: RES domain-containing protein, partial [Polyangiaceae bacterium]